MTAPINSNLGVSNNFNEIKNEEVAKKKDVTLFEAKESEPVQNTQKQTMPKLDYTSFPKKFRAFANELATRSQNEIKDLARDFNKNYPTTPYFVNYSEFPRPEDFSAKNLGGKEAAYHAWSSAVKEWVEDCKQDMQSMKDTGMKELSDQISKGFIQSWVNQGIATEVILDIIEKYGNDLNAANKELKEIVQKEHAKTRGTVKSEANHLDSRLEAEGKYTREVVKSEGEQTRDEVEEQAVKTRKNIEYNKKEEAYISELREKINLALRNKPEMTKSVIKRVLIRQGKRFDNRTISDMGGNGVNSIADVIANLDMDTLQAIVASLQRNSNPWTK